jgi:signal transduction histidine kinase
VSRTRDRLLAAGAFAAVVGVAVLIIVAVVQAERNGRQALERLQTAQTRQIAASMAVRVDGLKSLRTFFSRPLTMKPNDPADRASLENLATSGLGVVLVDAKGTVVNGLLLKSVAVGDHLEIDGLREASDSGDDFTVLPVALGHTTVQPVLPIVVPITGPGAVVRGAAVLESPVDATSAFNREVHNLGRGETGVAMFVDRNGVVIASSDPDQLAKRAPAAVRRAPKGFSRDDGKIVVVEPVANADWKSVFTQDSSEFEGGLTKPIQNALVLLAVLVVVGGGVLVTGLLGRLRAAREEQRRLAAINDAREEFVSIVSHELRTPVAGVLGFLQTTNDHWDTMSEEDRRHALTRAVANARRLQALTRDVLDTAALESGELRYTFEVVDVAGELQAAVTAAADAHPEHPVEVRGDSGAVPVRADPDRIQQVLTNLVDNAVQHSPGGATVELSLDLAGDDVVISVRDHGEGIPAGSLGRVFDKFVRGRSQSVRGTGLGLYICRRIVEAHGGRIWADNAADGGAVITFTLPVVRAAAPSEPTEAVGA